jgi:IQ and AAA domain-containing protein
MQGILARKYVDSVRDEEMEFLGISRKSTKNKESGWKDPSEMAVEQENARKKKQKEHFQNFGDAQEELMDEMRDNEGATMIEEMLKERRDWVTEYRRKNLGKIPDDIKDFHESKKQAETPEGEEGEEGAPKKEKGEKKDKKEKKEKGKGKKGKKGKKAAGEDLDITKIGPSETVQKFDEFYSDFNDTWATRDESENYKQEHDVTLAKDQVKPLLEKEFTKQIDEMIKIELENLKEMQGGGKKKKKGKKKKGKKGKKKKEKPLKLPGAKYLKGKEPEEILLDLVSQNIVKKLPPQHMSDFIGEFNYIAFMTENDMEPISDPSLALIRQLVTEFIIFPLGSEIVRSRLKEKINSVLFYGPPGTGKTLMIRSIITHTNAMMFDMSPLSIEGKFVGGKRQDETLIASVFMTAKKYQPSVIYIDECEKVWPAKKKKGKGKKGGGKKKKSGDPSDPKRIKKGLIKWAKSGAKFFDQHQRITILGCTSYPEEGSKKDFKKFFDKYIYFPFPDYSTRRLMWKNFIERNGGKLRSDFPLSTLAEISKGFGAGSILKTTEKVLTIHRVR